MPSYARTNAIGTTLRRIFRHERHYEPIEADGLIGECHTFWPEDEGFRAAWNDLLACSPAGTTFQSATWQQGGVGPTVDSGRLRLLTVRREQRLLAVVPMQLTRGGFLDSAGYAVSDYLDPLVDLWNEEESWRMILRLLDQQWNPHLRGVTLHNIRPGERCQVVLPTLATKAGFVNEWERVGNAARIGLPATWEEYLDSLDAHERKELRRKIRKAQTQADARLLVVDETNFEAMRLVQALDLIESADEGKRQWLREHVRPLLLRIGPQLVAEKRMRLLMLMLWEKPAACLIDFPSSRGPLLYNSGFDPAYRAWSPGMVTFALGIQQAIEQGHDIVDLLRGDEGYKYRLGAMDEPLYRLVLRK